MMMEQLLFGSILGQQKGNEGERHKRSLIKKGEEKGNIIPPCQGPKIKRFSAFFGCLSKLRRSSFLCSLSVSILSLSLSLPDFLSLSLPHSLSLCALSFSPSPSLSVLSRPLLPLRREHPADSAAGRRRSCFWLFCLMSPLVPLF